MQTTVHQKKESHSNFVCVGEGELSFTLSWWETPVPLLWWCYNLHILLSSIVSFSPAAMRSRTEAVGSSNSKEISEKRRPKLPSVFRCNAEPQQRPSQDVALVIK